MDRINWHFMEYFPYDYDDRPDQEELLRIIEKAFSKGKHAIIKAPSGFGKTTCSISSALGALVEKSKDGKILYCAASHQEAERAIDELSNINHEKKLDIFGICLKGKSNLCLNDSIKNTKDVYKACEIACNKDNPDQCLFFKNNAKNIIYFLDKLPCEVKATDIMDICTKDIENSPCPYSLAFAFAQKSKLVAVHFFYPFNPFLYGEPGGFFDKMGFSQETCVIIDEAHRLQPAIEGLLHQRVSIKTIDDILEDIYLLGNRYSERRELLPEFYASIERLFNGFKEFLLDKEDSLLKMQRRIKEEEENSRHFLQKLQEISARSLAQIKDEIKECIDRFDNENKIDIENRREPSFKPSLGTFLHIITVLSSIYQEKKEDSYAIFYDIEKGHIILHVRGLDIWPVIRPIIHEKVSSSVSLSGTLLDSVYQFQVLRDLKWCDILSKSDFELPFSKEKTKALFLPNFTSRFDTRSPETFQAYLDLILTASRETCGNTAAFCVSREFIDGIRARGFEECVRRIGKIPFIEGQEVYNENDYHDVENKIDAEASPSNKNSILIEKYKEAGNNGLGGVLLGVLRGRNSEGVDFPGDEMNTVVICGYPQPPPTVYERRKEAFYGRIKSVLPYSIKDYFIFQAVNQAAGRPVRGKNDNSFIIFADDRYCTSDKRDLTINSKRSLSEWILRNYSISTASLDEIGLEIRNFYYNKSFT